MSGLYGVNGHLNGVVHCKNLKQWFNEHLLEKEKY